MYNLARMRRLAREGLEDLLPAVRQAFNDDPRDDRLHLVYGSHPQRHLVLLSVFGLLAGEILSRAASDFTVAGMVHFGAVVLGIAHAALIRRYLFRSGQARPDDFPWLAASLAPAVSLLMLSTLIRDLAGALTSGPSVTPIALSNGILRSVTDAMGVATGFVIAVATLCYRRDWVRALLDLAVRLLVFRITLFVMVLLFVEIGIVGPIVAAIVTSVTGWHPPKWIADAMDLITYAVLLVSVLLAVVGGTWTTCRASFATLLTSGRVDILARVAELAQEEREAGDDGDDAPAAGRERRAERKAQSGGADRRAKQGRDANADRSAP